MPGARVQRFLDDEPAGPPLREPSVRAASTERPLDNPMESSHVCTVFQDRELPYTWTRTIQRRTTGGGISSASATGF
jgi:hypothetical protein